MAHNIEYSPVNIDENVPNAYNRNNTNNNDLNNRRYNGLDADTRHRPDFGFRGSDTSLVSKHSDGRKPRKFINSCTFSLVILGVSVTFLLGILIGFYVRESQTDSVDYEKVCNPSRKGEAVNYDVLGSRHDAVVNYIRGINIKKFVDTFGADDPVTGSPLEEQLENEIVSLFNLYGLDSVEVEEHNIVVTSPDPTKPNQLEVLHANGSYQHRFDLANPSKDDDDVNKTRGDNQNQYRSQNQSQTDDNRWAYPYVVFSPPGEIQSSLVYGHYGLESDFQLLSSLGVKVKGKVVLLVLGRTSVAEKILMCERFGATAVLLYRDSTSLDSVDGGSQAVTSGPDFIPTVSAAVYSTEATGLWKPAVPCQTISANQANILLEKLRPGNSNQVDATEDAQTQSGDLTVRDIHGKGTGTVTVSLHVFNKARVQTIRNIIGTIQGFSETDHYTIIGAPRSSLPGEFQDVVASTSLLTQLVHGFHFVHQLHQWKPRRGVKFISWGGSEFSNAGALHYIKKRHHLLDRRAIAYFDLRLLVTGKDFLTTQTSASLHQLLKEAAFEIPDPKDPEATLQSSWRDSMESASSQMFMPALSYDYDATQFPFLHILGIPTVRLQFVGSSNKTLASKIPEEEHEHHFKFHMAVIRVVAKALLSILDNEIVPLNMKYFAEDVSTVVWQTSGLMEDCSNDKENLNAAILACDTFTKTAEAFEELTKIFYTKKDQRGLEMSNSIKLMLEKLFVVRRNSLFHHILHPTLPDGSILLADDLCRYSASRKDWSRVHQFETIVENVINEAVLSLKMAA